MLDFSKPVFPTTIENVINNHTLVAFFLTKITLHMCFNWL